MLTLTDLQNKLKLIDEISLMEILEITSEDLVLRFVDKVELKYDQLVEEFEEDLDMDVDPALPEYWETDYE